MADLDEAESVVPLKERLSMFSSTSMMSRFFRKDEKKDEKRVFKWVIVSDPANKFIEFTKPFFVYPERTVMAYLAGPRVGRKFHKFLKQTYLFLILFWALEILGAYGVTELLPDWVSLLTLFAVFARFAYLFRLNTDILAILWKHYEFMLLVLSCILGTVGLMDAFNYDIRSALALDFLSLGIYAACQDATNKYSKRSLSVRSLVILSFILYANFSVVLLLIYFGYVPNLVNRTFFVATFETTVKEESTNSTISSQSGFTVGSLNITLGLVQAILIYLFKSPYHLSRNELAILQVSLYAKRVDLAKFEEEQATHIREAQTLQRELTQAESEVESEDEERVGSHVSGNSSVPGNGTMRSRAKRNLYRIAPAQNEFVVAGKPFRWERKDSVGSRLIGKEFASFCFKQLYLKFHIRILVALYVAMFPPLFILVLVNVVPRSLSWTCIPGFVLVFVYFNTLNYELLRRILQTTGVRVMLILSVLGNIGLGFSFKGDERTGGMVMLSITNFVLVACCDARIRTKAGTKYDFFLFTYLYITYGVLLVCFYLNLIVDIEDTRIDPSILSGKNATLQLTTVGYSLYCLEIVALFLARNYYSTMFKSGFSALEIRLRYFVQDKKDAVVSPNAESTRISSWFPEGIFGVKKNERTQSEMTRTSKETE